MPFYSYDHAFMVFVFLNYFSRLVVQEVMEYMLLCGVHIVFLLIVMLMSINLSAKLE